MNPEIGPAPEPHRFPENRCAVAGYRRRNWHLDRRCGPSLTDLWLATVLPASAGFDVVQAQSTDVGLYRVFERSVENVKSYSNKFTDVELLCSYTSPSGKKIDFYGFFDGDGKGGGNTTEGTVWKMRFMPEELGAWQYQWSWSDGTPGGEGTFICVTQGAGKGPLRPYAGNPRWLAYNGTEPVHLKSYYESSMHESSMRPFAQPFDCVREYYEALLDHGYNHLQVNWLLPILAGENLVDCPDPPAMDFRACLLSYRTAAWLRIGFPRAWTARRASSTSRNRRRGYISCTNGEAPAEPLGASSSNSEEIPVMPKFSAIAIAASLTAMSPLAPRAQSLPPETPAPFNKPDVPAFPGAEGAGMWTIGGRGGKVYEVTSLEDRGPGTLREACEAEGPRMVVFRKGGVIHLKKRLTITNPYITIAGQTAPGGGICIGDRPFWINTYQVIVRHIRVRMGAGDRSHPGIITDDAFGGRPVSDIMIDHVSASWGHDESLSFYKMDDVDNDGKVPATERVTVQWSIVGETLGERLHPYGGVFGGKHATYHRNLFACNVSWEPYKVIEFPVRPISLNPAPDDLNLVNNVLFVWLNRGLEGGGRGPINIINNYFVPDLDPYVLEKGREFHILNSVGSEAGGQPSRHIAGNIVKGHATETADNWAGIPGDVAGVRSHEPFEMFAPVTITSAEKAYEEVLAKSGATLPKRDLVDDRIVDATRNQKSYYLPIDVKQIDFYPFKVEGIADFPEYEAGTPPADDDHDGIPNEWELAKGLDPNHADDGAQIKDGYANLEWYLNELADGGSTAARIAFPPAGRGGNGASILAHLAATSSRVRFQLERASRVKLEILDIRGKRQAVLVNGILAAGPHDIPLAPGLLSGGLGVVRVTDEGNRWEARLLPVMED